jgi:hypothetical protein
MELTGIFKVMAEARRQVGIQRNLIETAKGKLRTQYEKRLKNNQTFLRQQINEAKDHRDALLDAFSPEAANAVVREARQRAKREEELRDPFLDAEDPAGPNEDAERGGLWDRDSLASMRAEGQAIHDALMALDHRSATNFARGIPPRLKPDSKIPVDQQALDFWNQRLEQYRAEKGVDGAAVPHETENTLLTRLSEPDRKLFDKMEGEDRDLVAAAEDKYADLVGFINDRGFKVENVNTGTEDKATYNAKVHLSSLSGQTARFIRDYHHHKRDPSHKWHQDDARFSRTRDELRVMVELPNGKNPIGADAGLATIKDRREAPGKARFDANSADLSEAIAAQFFPHGDGLPDDPRGPQVRKAAWGR